MAGVELKMETLIGFMRRIDRELSPEQREQLRRREAARTGVEPDAWFALAGATIDLELLRGLHRAVGSKQTMVRRTLRDGHHVLAAAQPGLLRTKPQGFRAGDFVEPAWDQGTLKHRLGETMRQLAATVDADPVGACARMLVALRSAQPFTGNNEATGIALASWCFARRGLPVLPSALATDATYLQALADGGSLESVLTRVLWQEALGFAEWLTVPPPSTAHVWTLREEHAMLAAARARVTRIATADIDAFVDQLAVLVAQQMQLQPRSRAWLDDAGARLQATWDSAARTRAICPHEPMLVARWDVAPELGFELVLILAAAGRGLTGGMTVQLALELTGVPARSGAALLLVPDEPAAQRIARASTWFAAVLPELTARAPLYGYSEGNRSAR